MKLIKITNHIIKLIQVYFWFLLMQISIANMINSIMIIVLSIVILFFTSFLRKIYIRSNKKYNNCKRGLTSYLCFCLLSISRIILKDNIMIFIASDSDNFSPPCISIIILYCIVYKGFYFFN